MAIGCEVEVYKDRRSRRFVMLDLNPGKVGGGKRIGAFAALDNERIAAGVGRIARSLSSDVAGDAYVLLDIQTGIERIGNETRITPFALAVKEAIEERGHRVKGFIGREKTFSQREDNWKRIEVDGEGRVAGVRFERSALEDLAASESAYLGCHFAPQCCVKNAWDAVTRRDGMVNNFLDLPGIAWTLLRDEENTPYADAFIRSKTADRMRRAGIPAVASVQEMEERIAGFRGLGATGVAFKGIDSISIGGRNVSIYPIESVLREGVDPFTLRGGMLVMPAYEFDAVETPLGTLHLQTRILYSDQGSPEMIVAKAYAGTEQNMSGFCDRAIVWDLEDGLHLLTIPEKGKLGMRRLPCHGELVSYFTEALDQCMDGLRRVEGRLLAVAGSEGNILKLYRDMKGAGAVPGSAHQYLNMFLGGRHGRPAAQDALHRQYA